jgi:hypothetical protein
MLAALDARTLLMLLGPVVGLIALVVTVYLWRRDRVRKAITYRFSAPPVAHVYHGVEDQIEILYNGAAVQDVRLLSLRIANTGNADIRVEDFETPFAVALGDNARVLGPPTVADRNPPDLKPEVTVEDGELRIAPLLLNAAGLSSAGDSFEVTALVSRLTEGEQLRARIAGVPKLINAATAELPQPRSRWRVAVLAVLFIAFTAWFFSPSQIKRIEDSHRADSLVTLRAGPSLCGEVLDVTTTAVVIRLKSTGEVRRLPVSDTRQIRHTAC